MNGQYEIFLWLLQDFSKNLFLREGQKAAGLAVLRGILYDSAIFG